jgi:hypothetical protein
MVERSVEALNVLRELDSELAAGTGARWSVARVDRRQGVAVAALVCPDSTGEPRRQGTVVSQCHGLNTTTPTWSGSASI